VVKQNCHSVIEEPDDVAESGRVGFVEDELRACPSGLTLVAVGGRRQRDE